MAIAKMTVSEVETFLLTEFPQAFKAGDISIESADGATCLLRQRYRDQMLRPGGTVSGPTLMALADFRYVCRIAVGDRADRPCGHGKPHHQFPSQRSARPGCARRRAAVETGQAACGRRSQPAFRDLSRSATSTYSIPII